MRGYLTAQLRWVVMVLYMVLVVVRPDLGGMVWLVLLVVMTMILALG